MQERFIARLLASALLLVVCPPLFAQLPPPPTTREVVAGNTYTESFRVVCVFGGGGNALTEPGSGSVAVRATVLPPAFTATVSPGRVSVGSIITLTAVVPITTPARPYQITIQGITSSSSDCSSGSETFTLFVRRPVRLTVDPSIQIVAPGSSGTFPVRIRRRTGFPGEVMLKTSGLPDIFARDFNPRTTTGNFSDLTVQVPPNTTQCLPPQGCRFQINGSAAVEVESADAQIVILGQVSLEPDRVTATIDPGREAVFKLRVVRLNYTGPVELAVTPIEQPMGGKFTTRVDPQRLTSEEAFTLGITIDPSAPGQYRFQVRPSKTGQTEIPITLTVQTSASAASITVTPESRTIDVGSSTDYDITRTGQVVLMGAEVDRVGPAFGVDVERGKLNVSTNPLTEPGTYRLTVVGSVMLPNGGTQIIRSNPVELVVRARAGGSISITADTDLKKIAPGGSALVDIDVLSIGGYRGLVTLDVPENLPGGVRSNFGIQGNTVELDGTDPIPDTRTIRLQAPLDAARTGPISIRVESTADPDAPRSTPSFTYMVTEPQLQFGTIIPGPGGFIIGRGSFDLFVEVFRNGCQSPLFFEYTSTPRDLFDIVFPFDVARFMVKVMTRPVAMPTPFDLIVSVSAVDCLGASFKLMGTLTPPPSIPPLVTATLAPAGQTIQRGQSGAYALTVNRGTTEGPIAIAVSGLPGGVTASVQPNPITGSTAQVTLSTSSTTPTGTFTFTVTATANGAQIAAATAGLTVVAPTNSPPSIGSFTPANGTAGTPVQITGTNFINVQNVLFNGTGAAFAPITPSQINATVPGFATTGPITVITAGGSATSALPFVIASSSQTPQITSFTPASGAAGTSVRLMGVNLGGVVDVSMGTPTLGFTPIPFTPFDATRIDVIIPFGAFSGFFRVTTLGGTTTSATAFNVTTPNLPEIGGFNPISGPAGTRVQIIGSNLGGATQVTFGGANASFEPPQANSIFATVPSNAMTGQIRVTTPAGTATSFASFAVTSGGPVITDFQPRSGQAGFSVTIAGVNLSGASEVTFNGVRAQIGIVTANFVQAFVPTGATTGPIRLVTPNGTATSVDVFTVSP
jgi:hypothetical protein